MNIGSNSRRLITMSVISRLKIEKERFVENWEYTGCSNTFHIFDLWNLFGNERINININLICILVFNWLFLFSTVQIISHQRSRITLKFTFGRNQRSNDRSRIMIYCRCKLFIYISIIFAYFCIRIYLGTPCIRQGSRFFFFLILLDREFITVITVITWQTHLDPRYQWSGRTDCDCVIGRDNAIMPPNGRANRGNTDKTAVANWEKREIGLR